MSDDLAALKVLIVSGSEADRQALRDAAERASVIITIVELDNVGEVAPACDLLSKGDIDVVFLDSAMALERRRVVAAAAHAGGRPPIIVSIEAQDATWSLSGGDGLPINGAIAKPVQADEARTTLAACVRARLPSRILVVDDSSTVRSVIRKVLQSSSYRFEIDEAAEGVTALQRADKVRFDVVMLDCNMPGIDSFTTLAMFLQSHTAAKVVMITATNDTKTADKARASGAHDVLYKPFYAKDVDAVMNRLYGLMGRKPR